MESLMKNLVEELSVKAIVFSVLLMAVLSAVNIATQFSGMAMAAYLVLLVPVVIFLIWLAIYNATWFKVMLLVTIIVAIAIVINAFFLHLPLVEILTQNVVGIVMTHVVTGIAIATSVVLLQPS